MILFLIVLILCLETNSNISKNEVKSTTVAVISTSDQSVDMIISLEHYPLSELGLRNSLITIRYKNFLLLVFKNC
jgi:hypothetical protein